LRYRIILIAALTLVAGVYLTPTVFSQLPQFWKDYLPDKRIHLGLDLRGGTHLVLTVQVAKAVENSLDQNVQYLRRELRDAQLTADRLEREGSQIVVEISDGEPRQAFVDMIEERFGYLSVADSKVAGGRVRLKLEFVQREAQAIRELAVDQSLETIRNRVDQFGVSEPIIQREGSQGILVQLPGIQDPQRAKGLIGRTALLELKILAELPAVETEAYLSGSTPLPPRLEILDGFEVDFAGNRQRQRYVVQKETLLAGDTITDARVRPGTVGEGPYVAFELNASGADEFERITEENVGRRLAIVLDDTVYSAPVIRERIPGGRASIEGSFDIKEARDLAIVLRAGALPAPVVVEEERTVGPSLGQDSIRQGITSFMVGGVLVVLFIVIYYKLAGVLADVALTLNIVFLLAALAGFQATLTLPGIAGIVLTLGMAVDANVLINERIREELRIGKTARAAIEAGYERALPAILDSNITTFLAGIILFQFGSGPVKGFAVTLCVGIVSTVFTAVVVTRTVYDYMLAGRRLQTVSI
jgi:preprotein translocase subunit SecD